MKGRVLVQPVDTDGLGRRLGQLARVDGRAVHGIEERHPRQRGISTRMVVRVAAVCAGHRQNRVLAAAPRAHGVEHADNLGEHPVADLMPQVIEAVHVVVERWPLGPELDGQRVDGQRIPARPIQERQCGVDDSVPVKPRCPRRGSAVRGCGLGRHVGPPSGVSRSSPGLADVAFRADGLL
ncbi:Uncharacterised protein [Mycobacteroides abscessus subsp. abscessus]|nr:Uncharacterised protein [Mycobacteroides abscessus subsp. abscessus]